MVARSALIVLAAALTVAGQTGVPPTANNPAQTRQARALLIKAKSYAVRINDRFQRDEIIDEIGPAQARAGDLEGAIDTASRSEVPAILTLNAIAEQLAQANDLEKAKYLGNKMKEGAPHALLSEIARSQAKAKRFAEAIRTAEEIKFLEVRSYALEDIAVLQAANGDFAAARQTFARARTAHANGMVTKEELEDLISVMQIANELKSPSQSHIDPRKPVEERVGLMLGVAGAFNDKRYKTLAVAWIEEALKEARTDTKYDEFFRYFAIPTLVKLGQLDAAMTAAAKLPGETRVKGFMAIAVSCAEMKDATCVENATAKMQTALRADEKSGGSDFGVKLMTLNVTAAMIDNGQHEAALRWLAVAEGNRKSASYESGVAPIAGKQRVLILAQQNRFAEALRLALNIKPDSITDNYRGTALRMLALLQTRKSGRKAVETWIVRLRKPEERAYALLGIAQALIGMEETKLGYATIHVH